MTIAVTTPDRARRIARRADAVPARVRRRLLLRNPDRLDAEPRDHVELVVGDQRDAERTGQGLGWAITNLRPAH